MKMNKWQLSNKVNSLDLANSKLYYPEIKKSENRYKTEFWAKMPNLYKWDFDQTSKYVRKIISNEERLIHQRLQNKFQVKHVFKYI